MLKLKSIHKAEVYMFWKLNSFIIGYCLALVSEELKLIFYVYNKKILIIIYKNRGNDCYSTFVSRKIFKKKKKSNPMLKNIAGSIILMQKMWY